jgi:SAM-dependent methyltransferase
MPVNGVWQIQQCPVCLNRALAPRLAKKPDMVYGECSNCGHGALLAPKLNVATYVGDAYYQQQGPNGVGYQDYAGEKWYREAKARRLLDWAVAGSPSGRFLEVGSGFGFTRKAAADAGWKTDGIDLNPAARTAALELYGFETVSGDVSSALDQGAIQPGVYDLVLYQFVLEHVLDPVAELGYAARLLSPRGSLFLLLPGMDAAELGVFQSSYRSLRSDHLHIFSWRSLSFALQRAGLRRERSTSECGVHLLSGFLDRLELADLYRRGLGPDMLVLARKEDAA